MRIDKAYKGVEEKTVVLWDSGMCDGPTLSVGEQYLMYTSDDGTGYLRARGCTRSRSVRFAKEDLTFLNGLSNAPATSTVFGEVTVRSGGIFSEGKRAPGVAVEIQGVGQTRKSTTDKDGRYSFSGLPPGFYSVKASLTGFRQSATETDDPVQVDARGCRVLDVVLRQNWNGTLRGRVTRADGTPGPASINVDLIRVDGDPPVRKRELLIGFTVRTDERGEYAFHGLPPGRYKVVLNLYRPPTAENPYQTLYWPAASTEGAASLIEINAKSPSQQCDFHLPPPLKSTAIKVVVLLPDGTPARDAHANIAAQMNGVFSWAGQAVTNSSGQVAFGAIEGLGYTVQDIFTREARMASPVHFSSADGVQPITIRLAEKEQ